MASRVFALVLNPAVSTYAAQGVTGKCDSSVSTYNNFAYDGVFNLTSVDSTIPSTSFGGTDSFTYDSKDRLTAQSSTRNYGFSESFAYDSAGNPTTFIGSSRSYNSNNQRTSGSSYAYDGNGNPTTYAGSTLGFDRENRLTAVGSNWTAGYRADGLRAYKDVGSTRTYYLYDQGEPLIEMDASGAAVAVNVFSPDGLVGRWTSASGTVYYSFDVQGSVAQRIDSSGNVLSSSCYDAYGAESSTGTAPTDCFGYNARWGYVLDRETGLYLCQHRYYDPANGRWMTRDPIGYAGGVNVYGYCESGPLNRIDRDGQLLSQLLLSDFVLDPKGSISIREQDGYPVGHCWVVARWPNGEEHSLELKPGWSHISAVDGEVLDGALSREWTAKRTLPFNVARFPDWRSLADLAPIKCYILTMPTKYLGEQPGNIC